MSRTILYRGAVYREAYLFTPEAEQYLYHCTTHGALADIAKHGLSPAKSSRRDNSVYLTEPAGLVQWIQYVVAEAPYRHLTLDLEGNVAEDFEPDETDPAVQPVVLRTKILSNKELDRCGTDDAKICLLLQLEHYSPEGSIPPYEPPLSRAPGETSDQKLTQYYRDKKQWDRKRDKIQKQLEDRAKAYRTQQAVPPQELDVWSRSGWVPVQRWRSSQAPVNIKELFAHLTDPTARFDPYTLEVNKIATVGFVYHVTRKSALPMI